MIQISRSGHFEARKENGNTVTGQISKDMLDALTDLIESTQAPEELLAEILTANTTPEQALRLRSYHPVLSEIVADETWAEPSNCTR
jgi:hypothetical protein